MAQYIQLEALQDETRRKDDIILDMGSQLSAALDKTNMEAARVSMLCDEARGSERMIYMLDSKVC